MPLFEISIKDKAVTVHAKETDVIKYHVGTKGDWVSLRIQDDKTEELFRVFLEPTHLDLILNALTEAKKEAKFRRKNAA